MSVSNYTTPCESPLSSLDATTIDLSLNAMGNEMISQNDSSDIYEKFYDNESEKSSSSTLRPGNTSGGHELGECVAKARFNKAQEIQKLVDDINLDLAEMQLLEQKFIRKMKDYRENVNGKLKEVNRLIADDMYLRNNTTQTELVNCEIEIEERSKTIQNNRPTSSKSDVKSYSTYTSLPKDETLSITSYSTYTSLPSNFISTSTSSSTKTISKKQSPKTYEEEDIKKIIVLQAHFRGYLMRRLMKTEKVEDIRKTIVDTIKTLETYKNDTQANVTKDDLLLHKRLMIQLEHSILEFHQVFFTKSKVEQMKIITRSRELRIERSFRQSSTDGSKIDLISHISASKSKISKKSPILRKIRLKRADKTFSISDTSHSSYHSSESKGKHKKTLKEKQEKEIRDENKEPVRKSQRLLRNRKLTQRKSTPWK